MQTIRNTFVALFGVGLLIGVIWALVNYVGLQASLVWGAIMGAVAWAVRTNVERRHEYQRLLADKKREQYYEFLEFINSILGVAGQSTEGLDNPEVIRQLRSWSLRLTMIGSDDVVTGWNKLRILGAIEDDLASEEKSARMVAMLKSWGDLWLAMRRDCGHADTKLSVADLLGSIINDIDVYRERLK